MRKLFVGCIVFLCATASVMAVAIPVIQVGDHSLLANTAGQKITLSITDLGSTTLAGINFYAQVGDGGPELAALDLPSGMPGPAITGVNLAPAGGIFAGKGTQTNLDSLPQLASSSFDVATGTVAANGTLVELTFDTTGFFAGTWDLLLSDVLPFTALGGPYSTKGVGTGGVDVQFSIQNGSITIVPEPLTLTLLGVGGLALSRRFSKRA